MEIITVQLSDIRGYENNAKLHPQSQIEQIKKSIADFGFNDPIAIDENNVIIEGHGRFKAIQQLGYTEVPCIRLSHMNEQQKKAYILAHNKLTMNTDFDPDMLAMELEGIIDFDMEEYGFDEDLLEERADCYDEMGMLENALADINKAMDLTDERNLPYYYGRRSEIYRHAGMYAEAMGDLEKFIERYPTDAYGYYARGWCKEL